MQEEEFIRLGSLYKDSLYRLCYTYLKKSADCDDAVQTALLKLYLCKKTFQSDEHAKNWLYKVAVNECKKIVSSPHRKNIDLEDADLKTEFKSDDSFEIISAVNSLDIKYRMTVYLHYYEGYTAVEIARLMKTTPSTVRTRLLRARKQLKEKLKGYEFD